MSLDQDDARLKEKLIKGTDDFQERRAQAIAAKALEIEKVRRTPTIHPGLSFSISLLKGCGVDSVPASASPLQYPVALCKHHLINTAPAGQPDG